MTLTRTYLHGPSHRNELTQNNNYRLYDAKSRCERTKVIRKTTLWVRQAVQEVLSQERPLLMA